MRIAFVALVSLLPLASIGASACSSSDDQVFGNGSGGAGGTLAASTSDVGVGGGLAGVCSPPCLTGQFCSAAVKCIPEDSCAHNGDCGDGLECDLDKAACVPGSACGSEEIAIEPIAPNLLVVLDRSCSMTNGVGGGKTRWQVAVAALDAMLTTYASKVRFGLTLFPDKVPGNCAQDAIPFSPGPGNEPAISMMLASSLDKADANYPSGPCVTNIDTAMQQAEAEPALKDPDRKSYVMLLTDGAQAGCNLAGGDAGTTNIISNLHASGVDTFVIGFAGGGDKVALNGFANAGGTALPNGPPYFYDAADAVALDKALNDIATATLGCSFKLGKEVSDVSQLFVFFDNDPAGVPRDPTHMEGWDYDSTTNSVTFYGMACTQLKDGTIKDVDLVFGCNSPSPN